MSRRVEKSCAVRISKQTLFLPYSEQLSFLYKIPPLASLGRDDKEYICFQRSFDARGLCPRLLRMTGGKVCRTLPLLPCHPERSGEGTAKAAQSNGSHFVISTEKGYKPAEWRNLARKRICDKRLPFLAFPLFKGEGGPLAVDEGCTVLIISRSA